MTRVLVDTSVWSLALRKAQRTPAQDRVVDHLVTILQDLRLAIIGPVRQEILSSLSDPRRYEELRLRLSGFLDESLSTTEFELAAEMHNTCRRHGIQGSHTDFLLCAVSQYRSLPILTLDRDFQLYRKHLVFGLDAEELTGHII